MASWWNWNPTSLSLNPLSWTGIGVAGELGAFKSPDAQSESDRKRLLAEQAAAAGGFANTGEQGFNQLGADARSRMDYLRNVANGGQSIAGEQLRQGTQALQAQQQSMAASAAPRDAGAAAHAAMLNSARLGYGMSGQAATAGLQERRDAEAALANMINQQRQQDLQAALGSRQTAISGYGAGNAGAPGQSPFEKYGLPLIQGFLGGASKRG